MPTHVMSATGCPLAGALPGRVRSTGARTHAGTGRTRIRSRQAGFTLVEVVVAIAILSIALGSLMAMIGSALRQAGQADRMAEAGALAQSLLARLGPELPLGERQDTGRFSDGFR
jgi:prepilin-type N-terminal cleavage/methylation domain-containing protein